MPIKLSSAFLIRAQPSFSAKEKWRLIDSLVKAMFRQMALGNIRLVFLKLPRLSDGDVLGKQVGEV